MRLLIVVAACVVAVASEPADPLADLPLSARKLVDASLDALGKSRQQYLAGVQKEQDRLVAGLTKEQEAQTRAGKLDAALAIKACIERVRAGELLASVEGARPAAGAGDAAARIRKEAEEFHGHQYALVKEPARWGDAARACERLGGHLVAIADRDENFFVAHLAEAGAAWIGARDEAGDGRFAWVDGQRLAFDAWLPGQPDPAARHPFVAIVGGGWKTAEDQPLPFVCEWDSTR